MSLTLQGHGSKLHTGGIRTLQSSREKIKFELQEELIPEVDDDNNSIITGKNQPGTFSNQR